MENYKCPECGKQTTNWFMGVRTCKEHCNQQTMNKHANNWFTIMKQQEDIRESLNKKIYPERTIPGTIAMNCAYCDKEVPMDESTFIGINGVLRCVHIKCNKLNKKI